MSTRQSVTGVEHPLCALIAAQRGPSFGQVRWYLDPVTDRRVPVDSCQNLREGRFIASRKTSAWSYWLKALFTRRLTGAGALLRAMRSSCVVRAWISR